MRKLTILAMLGVGIVLCMSALQFAGTRANWEFSALNVFGWLAVVTAVLVLYLVAYITLPKWRWITGKTIEILLYLHIGIYIFELWQNSASFPPISTRQYIVEIAKLSLVYSGAAMLILFVRGRLLEKSK